MVFKWVIGRADCGEDESALIPVRFEVTVEQLMKMFSRQLEIQKSELYLCIPRGGRMNHSDVLRWGEETHLGKVAGKVNFKGRLARREKGQGREEKGGEGEREREQGVGTLK